MELEQGSVEWHSWRAKGIGSSEISAVVNVNPYKTRLQLWEEKTGLVIPEDISQKYHVKRGTMLEPKARDMCNNELNSKFVPAIFTHPEMQFCKYSSDGIDWDRNEIIEIKCMGEKNHNLVIDTNLPIPYYVPQLQWGMRISNTELCHFVSYCPASTRPYKRIEVKADKEYQDYLLIEAKIFWKLVESKTRPD